MPDVMTQLDALYQQQWQKTQNWRAEGERLRGKADERDRFLSKLNASDEVLRLRLNNERQGMAFSDGSPFVGDPIYQKQEIIRALAERGEPLGLAMHEYFQFVGYSVSVEILNCSDIPKKLLLRKMTEREYSGYLHGELPIATLAFRGQHYLPKPQTASV